MCGFFIINFEKKTNIVAQTNYDTITLGGGCYWCVEAIYEMLDGVKSVESGFSGGKVANPSYREVCMGTTGHAEVVQIVYDNKKTSLDEILKVFFTAVWRHFTNFVIKDCTIYFLDPIL